VVARFNERGESGSCEAKARKGNAPGRMKPKGARDIARGEITATMCPNRQRDETPEARPLRQQCLKRRKRLAPEFKRDRSLLNGSKS